MAERAFLRGLVLEAGRQALAAAAGTLTVQRKGRVNLVTQVDREVQDRLVAGLASRYPDATIVAEEQDEVDRRSEGLVWYVDPLDGTTNFVHGHPAWAVSVGGWVGGEPRAAAVYAPALDEMFLATYAQGATYESPDRGGSARPLRTSACRDVADALLGTGFPYSRGRLCRLNLRCVAEALARARGVRRSGSAALDLCWLAAGRLDGFWEPTLRPWDVAAGGLIAAEAGAVVTDYRGGSDWLWGRRIVAAAPGVHAALRRMLAEAHERPEDWPLGRPFEGSVPLDRTEEEEPL